MNKVVEIYDKRNAEIARQRAAQLAADNDAVLKKAQSYLSMQNAEEALKALWNYRNGSEAQNAQYNEMVAKAGGLVSEEKKRILDAERQRYLDARMREDREWSMKVQGVEHQQSLDNREMTMRENAAAHEISMDNKQHDLQVMTITHDMKIEDKMTVHQMQMEHRGMDYNFAVLDANTQTEQQKIDAAKTVACEFIKKNPNFINKLK